MTYSLFLRVDTILPSLIGFLLDCALFYWVLLGLNLVLLGLNLVLLGFTGFKLGFTGSYQFFNEINWFLFQFLVRR